MEHDVGRRQVRAMSDGLDRLRRGESDAVTAIRESIRAYRDLFRAHIHKENNVLYLMADQLVPDDVAERMVEQFEEIERDRVDGGKHEAYDAMLHHLKDLYGVTLVCAGTPWISLERRTPTATGEEINDKTSRRKDG